MSQKISQESLGQGSWLNIKFTREYWLHFKEMEAIWKAIALSFHSIFSVFNSTISVWVLI